MSTHKTLVEKITETVDALGLPDIARDGSCIVASDMVCSALLQAAIDAKVRLVVGNVDHLGTQVVGFLHYAVVVGDSLVVDATATQFDPELAKLIVAPVDEYLAMLSKATGAAASFHEF